jgi:tRNA 2-thiouridine synthesizing protein A
VRTVDARGLKCPLPLVKTKLAIEELAPGETVRVLATDPEAPIDLAAWAGDTGHSFRETGPGEYELTKFAGRAPR